MRSYSVRLRAIATGVVLSGLLSGCSRQNQATSALKGSQGNTSASSSLAAPTQDETAFLPDSSITPGDALSDVTVSDICTPGYSSKVRNVPSSVKQQAYANYNIATHQPGEYEVDHLISLELGGSNSIKNLWPQSYKTQPWNAHVKDKLENELHSQVCSGQIDIKTAQQDIATNWIETYKRIFHTDGPLASGKSRSGSRSESGGDVGSQGAVSAPSGDTAQQVWVNTKSGKYFLPSDRYYGKTKSGEYLSESEAISQGYHAAGRPAQ